MDACVLITFVEISAHVCMLGKMFVINHALFLFLLRTDFVCNLTVCQVSHSFFSLTDLFLVDFVSTSHI